MKRIISSELGVDVPLCDCDSLAMVVLRVKLVVSADGGGGKDVMPDSVETRQRKHSPLPKYDGAGCGYSERYAPKV